MRESSAPAHEAGRSKRPESVLVVIYTQKGEVLMLLRHAPRGFWQSVTGSLREGESPLEAARREVREETGLHAGNLLQDCQRVNRYVIMPQWRHRYAPEVRANTEHVFAVRLPRRVDVALDEREHQAYVWLPTAAAAARAASATDRWAIISVVERAG